MGKGQNNEQSQTMKADPWKPIQPYLKGAFADAERTYQQGAPGFFPGQTVAGMSGYSNQAFQNMANRAQQGNPLMGQASGEIGKMLNGDYLDPNNNPGFQGALSAAIRPITQAFSNEVMPGIDSMFSGAGRTASGMHGQAYSNAQQDLARGIGDVSSNMAFNNYGMERGNMMNAIPMAQGMADNDYRDISMLGLAGSGLEGYDQRMIDAERERYDYNANKDMSWLQNYVGLLGGAPPPTTTETVKTPAPNPWVTAAGLGLQGASMLGGMPPGTFSGMFGGGYGSNPISSSPYDPRFLNRSYGGPR
jgi:hypothetical protein